LQHNYDSEVEDLINPKDELRKKIVNLANTIRKWNEERIRVRKSVRDQLIAIADLGLNKYKMQRVELRKLTEEIFRYHGISESWLRKLLPKELKDTSKTRISYLQKQEMEKERQRLLQQKTSESRQELEIRENVQSNDITIEPGSHETTKLGLNLSSSVDKQGLGLQNAWKIDHKTNSSVSEESFSIQNKLDEANNRIVRLEEKVQWLSKPFTASAYLQVSDQDIPLVVQIDPVKKAIISIQIDKSY
jgi:hypothetical protein